MSDTFGNLRHALQHVELAAAVAVAVRDEQHFRLDLAEAVEHPVDAEIRRAGRPYDALRERRQGQHPGLWNVGDEGRDAVARPQPQLRERLRGAGHFAGQVGVAEAPLEAAFIPVDEGVAAIPALEHVLGEIQARLGKPLRAGQLVAVDQHGAALFRGDDAAAVPDLAPEFLRVVDRPIVEIRIAMEVGPILAAHLLGELGDLRLLYRLIRR
jgi:hypothetical protein